MKKNRLDELFDGLLTPSPPPDLRRRSLEAAARAPAGETVIDIWTRLWASRTARWAWATAVVLLLAANVMVNVAPNPVRATPNRSAFLIAGLQLEGDLAGARARFEAAIEAMPDLIQAYDISPHGKRAVIEARGELFSVPAKHGVVQNLSRSSGSAERFPAWSPDGKHIAAGCGDGSLRIWNAVSGAQLKMSRSPSIS